MSEIKRQKLTARAVIMVIGCILLTFVNTGISSSCGYPFVVPMATDLGLDTSALSFMFTFLSLLSFIGAFAVNFFIRKLPYKVMVILGGVCIGLGWIIQATSSTLPMFYIAAALRGFGSSFCTNVVVNSMLNSWFRVGVGTVTGLVTTMQSVAPAIFSAPIAKWLTTMGWRTMSWAFAILVLVVNILVAIIAVVAKPQDVGQIPIGTPLEKGAEDEQPKLASLPGITLKDAMKTKQFWMLLVAATLQMFILVGFSVQRTPAIMAMGVDLVQSGIIVSVLSAAAIVYQLVFGVVVDKLGIRFAFCCVSVLYIGAMVIGALSPQGFGWAMLFGCLTAFYACGSMYVSLGTKDLFGAKEFGKIMAFVYTPAMAGTVVGSAAMNALVGLFGGSFRTPLWIWVGLTVICMILVCLANTKKNRFVPDKAAAEKK